MTDTTPTPIQTTEAHSTAMNALRIRDMCANFNHDHAKELLIYTSLAKKGDDNIWAGHGRAALHQGGSAHDEVSEVYVDGMIRGVELTLQSDVWSIASDCCHIIETIAEQMPEPPDRIIHTSQIVEPFGWMYLGAGLEDRDSNNLAVPLVYHALSWGIVKLDLSSTKAEWALMIVPWVWTADRTGKSQQACIPLGPSTVPLGSSLEEFMDWDDDGYDWKRGGLWLLRYLLATFEWSSSEVARQTVPLIRQQRRQQARQGRDTTEVIVVKLRRLESSERSEGDGDDGGQISKAHLRSGHWRWQGVGEGRKESRLTWVRPTVVRPDLLAEGELLPEKKQRIIKVDR